MELLEIFQVLGIERTKEERDIKNAYRKKLAVTNPEDDPEGFKRLRNAYEQACAYAKTPEEEAEPEKEEDNTPSGLWVQRAAAIYGNIITRQDEDKWRQLFAEDIFLSLEEEENCRNKLIYFLMDHYKLPTAIWKLLDERLFIMRDMAKLRESFPPDFLRYIAGKCERGEDVEFSQFEGEEDAPYDLFLQYYDRCWQALMENQLKQAEDYIRNADELKIFHPVMEICRANLLIKKEKPEEAIAVMAALRQRFPEDAMINYNAAEILWKNDKKEAGAKIFAQLKSGNDTHYMANLRLCQWYYEQGRYQDAKKCAEVVLSSGGDDAFMELLGKINAEIEKDLEEKYAEGGEDAWEAGLDLGWCYLQDGKISRGISLTEELASRVSPERETERKGLLTKLLIEQAEYEQAIEQAQIWEKALEEKIERDETDEEREKDRDRIRQAHLIRMQGYRNLGYADGTKFPLAIAELESIETGTSGDIGLLLEKAQIYMEMEEYDKSLDLVRRLVEEYQIYAAYATALEVYRRQWNAAGVIQAGRQCISHFPSYARAYEHSAKVYLDLQDREELFRLLEEAEKNGVRSVILDAYRYQAQNNIKQPDEAEFDRRLERFRRDYAEKVNAGDMEAYEKGLPIVTDFLYLFPGTYMLVERGIFHRAAHRYEEAREDFEKALAENPAQHYALRGLSLVYKYMGDYEKGLFYIKKAILYGDGEMSPLVYGEMATLYRLAGNYGKALEAYRRYCALTQERVRYHLDNMIECLVMEGELEEAEKWVKKIYSRESEQLAGMSMLARLYENACLKEESRLLLEQWEKLLKNKLPLRDRILLRAGVLKTETFFKLKGTARKALKAGSPDLYEFGKRKAWYELMYGERETALWWFDICVIVAGDGEERRTAWTDASFAAILCGDEKRGRKYTQSLQKQLEKEKKAGGRENYNRGKDYLQMEILAAFYTEDAGAVKELLDREKQTEACRSCAYGICKEMEAVRILYLFHTGREKEAEERLKRNLRRQPKDEYMAAIRHMKG